jgi:membrane protein
MVSLVLGAAIAALGKWWGPAFGGWETLLQIVNLLVGFALTTAVFALIYKMMPRVKVQWHDVWLGALVTSLLFTIGKFLIGLYIGKSGVASGFGAAGSLVIVFIWVYYSAQIFLLGAEFTWVYAKTLGSLRGKEGVAEVAQARAGMAEVPSRSAEAKTPASAGAKARLPADPRLTPERSEAPATLGDVGAGIAFFFALRFVIPRLLRRL